VTGLGLTSLESCPAKLCWFQRNRPEIWNRAGRIMTISDYLVYSLTGKALGDAGTASLLGMWDLRNGQWWDEALRLLDLSPEQLSSPLVPGSNAGAVRPEGESLLGLKRGIPLAVGGLDHHVAAIGAGAGAVAPVSESNGTVLACLSYSDIYHPLADCCMGPGEGRRRWYQLAFSNNGAGGLEWYQRNFAPDKTIDDLARMAASVETGSDGLMASPMSGEGDGLDGFLGRADRHGHGHYVRAIMESTAATLVELVDILCPDGRPEKIVATGGGARSDLWLQMKADLIGAEFVATECREPACLGAALLAAVAAGWFAGVEEASPAWVSVRKTFRPNAAAQAASSRWLRAYRARIASQRPH